MLIVKRRSVGCGVRRCSSICRSAEDLQIREKLVVILQSEMGRTPNYGDGKDH